MIMIKLYKYKKGGGLARHETPQGFFVCEFRAVKLDLDFFAVQSDVAAHPEGKAIFDPRLPGNLFGDDLFKHFAAVVSLVQQVSFGADEVGLAGVDQRELCFLVQPDANLCHAAASGGRAVKLEKLFVDLFAFGVVETTSEDKTDDVFGGLREGEVSGQHFDESHGFDLLSCPVVLSLP